MGRIRLCSCLAVLDRVRQLALVPSARALGLLKFIMAAFVGMPVYHDHPKSAVSALTVGTNELS